MYLKLYGVVFILFVFNVATSLSASDDPKEEPRISRHSRLRSKENKIAKTKIVEDVTLETDRNEKEIPDRNLLATDSPLIRSEDDVSRAGISDGTNTEISLDHTEDASENSRSENEFLNNVYQNLDAENYPDVMVDVKGRSGHVQEESSGVRTQQIIPEDYLDSIYKSHEFRSDYLDPRHPFNNNENIQQPKFYGQNKRFMFKDMLLQPYQNLRYHPAYWNKLSQEIYPKSQENWGQYGQYAQSIPPYRSSDNCPTCHQYAGSQGHYSSRRSVEIPYLTANGRSLETEPEGSNSYPYFARETNDGKQDTSADGKPGRTLHQDLSNKQDNMERISKFRIQNSSPIVMNRRVGLTGYHIISGFN